MLNLIGNAVKFSRADGVVQVGLGIVEDSAELVVADHGIGVPEAELRHLGSRFFRASNAVTSEIGGTGLGLWIVQTILRNHRGVVTLDSVEGEGTTVRMRLPLADARRPAMDAGEQEHPGPLRC